MQRHVWLLKYCSASVPRLEAGAFEAFGSLPIDECYTATVGGEHHTLVYLKKRDRETLVQRFMVDYGNRQEPARVVVW